MNRFICYAPIQRQYVFRRFPFTSLYYSRNVTRTVDAERKPYPRGTREGQRNIRHVCVREVKHLNSDPGKQPRCPLLDDS